MGRVCLNWPVNTMGEALEGKGVSGDDDVKCFAIRVLLDMRVKDPPFSSLSSVVACL